MIITSPRHPRKGADSQISQKAIEISTAVHVLRGRPYRDMSVVMSEIHSLLYAIAKETIRHVVQVLNTSVRTRGILANECMDI